MLVPVGVEDGLWEGAIEGEPDGLEEGERVGVELGDIVGVCVGEVDGELTSNESKIYHTHQMFLRTCLVN